MTEAEVDCLSLRVNDGLNGVLPDTVKSFLKVQGHEAKLALARSGQCLFCKARKKKILPPTEPHHSQLDCSCATCEDALRTCYNFASHDDYYYFNVIDPASRDPVDSSAQAGPSGTQGANIDSSNVQEEESAPSGTQRAEVAPDQSANQDAGVGPFGVDTGSADKPATSAGEDAAARGAQDDTTAAAESGPGGEGDAE